MSARDLIPTSAGPMTGCDVVDYLTYCSYAAQRDYGMPAESAMKLLNVPASYEERYQEQCQPGEWTDDTRSVQAEMERQI